MNKQFETIERKNNVFRRVEAIKLFFLQQRNFSFHYTVVLCHTFFKTYDKTKLTQWCQLQRFKYTLLLSENNDRTKWNLLEFEREFRLLKIAIPTNYVKYLFCCLYKRTKPKRQREKWKTRSKQFWWAILIILPSKFCAVLKILVGKQLDRRRHWAFTGNMKNCKCTWRTNEHRNPMIKVLNWALTLGFGIWKTRVR